MPRLSHALLLIDPQRKQRAEKQKCRAYRRRQPEVIRGIDDRPIHDLRDPDRAKREHELESEELDLAALREEPGEEHPEGDPGNARCGRLQRLEEVELPTVLEANGDCGGDPDGTPQRAEAGERVADDRPVAQGHAHVLLQQRPQVEEDRGADDCGNGLDERVVGKLAQARSNVEIEQLASNGTKGEERVVVHRIS